MKRERNNSMVWLIIILLLVALGFYVFSRQKDAENGLPETTSSEAGSISEDADMKNVNVPAEQPAENNQADEAPDVNDDNELPEGNEGGEGGTGAELLCPEIYSPVCGTVGDKKETFNNECEANKAGAVNITAGICIMVQINNSEKLLCPEIYDPVCGTLDGKKTTFHNECIAKKAQAASITKGICAGDIQISS